MPFYQNLDSKLSDDERTIRKTLELRKELRKKIPKRTLEETLLVATWNIRDFDKTSYGYRTQESIHYIAEIISSFDIVAVQEVYRDLSALKRLMKVLGGYWKYVVSGVTEGQQGNNERMAYLYDSRKIKFGGLAGGMVVPPKRDKNRNVIPSPQIWRTPLIAGFKAGWATFMLCSVHVLWGKGKKEDKQRAAEIERIADFLKKRTEDPTAWARKLILLGDFNIFGRETKLYEILENHGFTCPPQLETAMTNANMTKQYDQVLLREREDRFEVLDGGVFNFFDYVFKDDEEDIYKDKMIKDPDADTIEYYKSYKSWKTHQMSDHLPLWVELKIDYADEYLNSKLGIS